MILGFLVMSASRILSWASFFIRMNHCIFIFQMALWPSFSSDPNFRGHFNGANSCSTKGTTYYGFSIFDLWRSLSYRRSGVAQLAWIVWLLTGGMLQLVFSARNYHVMIFVPCMFSLFCSISKNRRRIGDVTSKRLLISSTSQQNVVVVGRTL